MAILRDLSTAQIVFQVTGGEPDQFLVVRFRGTEGLCQLFRLEIDLVSTSEQIAFDDVVGKAAVLSVNASDGTRWFHGVVSRFELTGEANGQMYFAAEMVPAVWLLTHRYNCRIFQNQTVPKIISEVLTTGGIASDRVKPEPFKGNHPTREYCVQYRETDYNFIARLMEEEGIWWYFEHTQDGHTLVLADDPAGYQPIEGENPALPYVPPSGLNVAGEHVYRFRLGQEVRPGVVALNDFNFEDPKLDLKAKANSGRDTGLEFSDYPGEYNQQAVGKDLAKLRIEEFESARVRGHGQSNCPRLTVGRTFNLTEHPSSTLNGAYLLTSIVHQGRQSVTRTTGGSNGHGNGLNPRMNQTLAAARQSADTTVRDLAVALGQIAARLERGDPTAHKALAQWLYHGGQVSSDLAGIAAALGRGSLEALALPRLLDSDSLPGLDETVDTYECRFECIPAAVPFRPPRITPWPVMRGSQTARVVGPSGEEIYTDKYGRVKVQFNWDRAGKFDDKSSCWIRVSQGFAGGAYGMLFLPRVGQEVIVDFLEGDPDKPVITGRLYNADHMPAYRLPDEKTKSYIKTHSSKGGGGTNEIRFEDLKGSEQILIYAHKDYHVRVKNDRVENVDNDRHLTVKHDSMETIQHDRSLTIECDDKQKVGGKRSVVVQGNVIEEFKGAHSEKVQMERYLKAQKVVVEADMSITFKGAGGFVQIDPAGVTISGNLVLINSGGSAIPSSVSDSATDPAAPKTADKGKPGKDTSYSGGQEPAKGEAPPDIKSEFENQQEEPERSWVEFQLLDAAGNPVSGEPYRVILPDDTLQTGQTDGEGLCRFYEIEPGTARISFPQRGDNEWHYLRTLGPGQMGGGGAQP